MRIWKQSKRLGIESFYFYWEMENKRREVWWPRSPEKCKAFGMNFFSGVTGQTIAVKSFGVFCEKKGKSQMGFMAWLKTNRRKTRKPNNRKTRPVFDLFTSLACVQWSPGNFKRRGRYRLSFRTFWACQRSIQGRKFQERARTSLELFVFLLQV